MGANESRVSSIDEYQTSHDILNRDSMIRSAEVLLEMARLYRRKASTIFRNSQLDSIFQEAFDFLRERSTGERMSCLIHSIGLAVASKKRIKMCWKEIENGQDVNTKTETFCRKLVSDSTDFMIRTESDIKRLICLKESPHLRHFSESIYQDIVKMREGRYNYNDEEGNTVIDISIVRKVMMYTSDYFISIFQKISKHCIDLLGPPPCRFAHVGMGSLARQDFTPYSDFENMILLEDGEHSKEVYQYFRWYSMLFQIIILHFGDTPLQIICAIPEFNDFGKEKGSDKDCYWDDVITPGIWIDSSHPFSSKTPLSVMGPIPEASLLFDEDEIDELSSDDLAYTCFVAGDKKLYGQFENAGESMSDEASGGHLSASTTQQFKNFLPTHIRISMGKVNSMFQEISKFLENELEKVSQNFDTDECQASNYTSNRASNNLIRSAELLLQMARLYRIKGSITLRTSELDSIFQKIFHFLKNELQKVSQTTRSIESQVGHDESSKLLTLIQYTERLAQMATLCQMKPEIEANNTRERMSYLTYSIGLAVASEKRIGMCLKKIENGQDVNTETKMFCRKLVSDASHFMIKIESDIKQFICRKDFLRLDQRSKSIHEDIMQMREGRHNYKDEEGNTVLDVPMIRGIMTSTSEYFISIFQKISNHCLDLLGPPPCIFAHVGMGSLARQDFTPFSDFESMILLEEGEHSGEVYQYFRWYSVLFHIIILYFGETPLRNLAIPELNDFSEGKGSDKDWFWDDVIKPGIRLDSSHPFASKTPLGRDPTKKKPFEMELIKTVSEMAWLLLDNDETEDTRNGYHIIDVLLYTRLIFGDKEVFKEFEIEREKMLYEVSSSDMVATTSKQFRINLPTQIDIFNLVPIFQDVSPSTDLQDQIIQSLSFLAVSYDYKDVFHRLACSFLTAVAKSINLNMSEDSLFDLIGKLHERGIFNESTKVDLEYLIACIYAWRDVGYTDENGQVDCKLGLLEGCCENLAHFDFDLDYRRLISIMLGCKKIIEEYLKRPSGEESIREAFSKIGSRIRDEFDVDLVCWRLGIDFRIDGDFFSCNNSLSAMFSLFCLNVCIELCEIDADFTECTSELSSTTSINDRELFLKLLHSSVVPEFVGELKRLLLHEAEANEEHRKKEWLQLLKRTYRSILKNLYGKRDFLPVSSSAYVISTMRKVIEIVLSQRIYQNAHESQSLLNQAKQQHEKFIEKHAINRSCVDEIFEFVGLAISHDGSEEKTKQCKQLFEKICEEGLKRGFITDVRFKGVCKRLRMIFSLLTQLYESFNRLESGRNLVDL